ncbi:MAG: AzlD domain-containing protein [Kineosporiaceae bacterium]
MSGIWVIATSIALYLEKLVGVSVPEAVLDRPWVRRVLGLLPVALLSALTVVQTLDSEAGPVVDARAAGVAAAAVALALRAPFLVVVVVAAATAAGVRALL